jgi:hypothetical protein
LGDGEPFQVDYVVVGNMHARAGDMQWPNSPLATPGANSPAKASPGSMAMTMHGSEPCTPATLEAPGAIKLGTPPADMFDINEEADNAPLRFRSMADILGGVPPQRSADTQLTEQLLATIGDELSTMEEALVNKPWHTTMVEELGSIKENNTWSLVDLPSRLKPIDLNWVFKQKHEEHGEVLKYKARLVAKGYVQRQGIDFDEVFTPVARMESVSVILILATHLNWSVHHMVVKSTFLNGDLGEEVYRSQLLGFIKKGQEQKVYKL